MKKLTAGIFATLLAVVSADGAYAAIASKGYVDDQVGEVQTAVTAQIATKADSSTVTALDGRVDAAEGEIDALQTEVGGKQDALGFTPENSANKTTTLSGTSTDTQYPSAKAVWDTIQTETTGIASDADVTALKGRVDTLETASATHATKTELSEGLATKANTADLGALATLSAVGSAQITDGSVATADIADKAVTEAKLSDTVNASLDLADSALQQADLAEYQTKDAADAAYAVKALEGQVGVVSATNMGTTATTVVTAIKEVAGEAADAATAAAGAQNAVDTVESTIAGYGDIVTHNASEFATSAQGAKADTAVQPSAIADMQVKSNLTDAAGWNTDKSSDTKYPSNAAVNAAITSATSGLATDSKMGDLSSLTTDVKTNLVGAINEVDKNADDAKTAADAAQEDATQALADATTAQSAAEAAQQTADTKQDKLTGTIGGSMQPVYLNNGTITAGTALGTLATKNTVTNSEVADGALAQSKINGLATSLAAKLTTPPTSERGETGLYVLTYDGTDFQWEDIARTAE